MRRAILFLACVAGVVLMTGGVAAVTVGCGTPARPAIASPEHIGTWNWDPGSLPKVRLDVAGEPGQYTAKYTLLSEGVPPEFTLYSSGQVDERGNLTFQKSDWGDPHLTLGPVSGDEMTAYFPGGPSLDMVRQ